MKMDNESTLAPAEVREATPAEVFVQVGTITRLLHDTLSRVLRRLPALGPPSPAGPGSPHCRPLLDEPSSPTRVRLCPRVCIQIDLDCLIHSRRSLNRS